MHADKLIGRVIKRGGGGKFLLSDVVGLSTTHVIIQRKGHAIAKL